MIPDQEDEFSEVVSNINLLNTIKVPLNLQRLQDDLPKSNYDNKSFKSAEEGEK